MTRDDQTPAMFRLPGDQTELVLEGAAESDVAGAAADSSAAQVHDPHLQDLEPVIQDLFSVWWDGSESAWVAYAWSALAARRLTRFSMEVERAQVVCRLGALSVVYREFCARALDEGSPGDWRWHLNELLGEYPRIEPFTLGMLAEREAVGADVETGSQFAEGPPLAFATDQLVRAAYKAVTTALLEEWGAAELVGSLRTSARADAVYPLSDEEARSVMNIDVTGGLVDAWMWVDDGMDLW